MSLKYFALLSRLAYCVTSAQTSVEKNTLNNDDFNIPIHVSSEWWNKAVASAENENEKSRFHKSCLRRTLLCNYSITTLSHAVKMEFGVDGEITFEKLLSDIITTPIYSNLNGLKSYLLDNVFVDGKDSIGYRDFTMAVVEFNHLGQQKNTAMEAEVRSLLETWHLTNEQDSKIIPKEQLSRFLSLMKGLGNVTNAKEFEKILRIVGIETNTINVKQFNEAIMKFNDKKEPTTIAKQGNHHQEVNPSVCMVEKIESNNNDISKPLNMGSEGLSREELIGSDNEDDINEINFGSECLRRTLLCNYSITTLSHAFKMKFGVDGEITFEKLQSDVFETPIYSNLNGFKAYLLDNVFVDGKQSISYRDFTMAMVEFNHLEQQKIFFGDGGQITGTEINSF